MSDNTPTAILVHGAFADGSSWSHVIDRLRAEGVDAIAVSNPLRGLAHDGDYVAAVVGQVDGPVVLVGHSYGGPVITHAGAKAPNVKALVYVASFGIDTGESALGSVESFPPVELGTSLAPQQFPDGEGTDTEFTIRRDAFPSVFAADLPAEFTATAAATQRPIAARALAEPLAVEPAWKTLPSWFAVATEDNAIHPDSQRAAAKRLGATTVEVRGSHAIAVSRPDEVAALVLAAVRAVA
ncbi:alpha/beta fold hydrolase [Saccharothrix yanglingensis]|uniref:Alpha/beta hydrolase n=1 Tax=Saccharothrix yanglingensis TaxID=659496 RepID=A0ABU0XAT8_9PSEU|nr:alpha/beta hydrolase [Saccharothrix yanglingensis]MDQ2589256.1 alpha/beta hydrolase [Saccharothrix yanglingensis]